MISKSDVVSEMIQAEAEEEYKENPYKITFSHGKILQRAHEIINGERQTEYGDVEDNFGCIAEIWELYCRKAHIFSNRRIKPSNVADMMALFKIARLMTGTQTEDSCVDACGYLALGHDLRLEEKRK